MATMTKERRVTFSSKNNNIAENLPKKEGISNGGLTPILKSKCNEDLIQFDEEEGNKSGEAEEESSAANANIYERSSGAETEEEAVAATLLRTRSRQLMRQYIIHRNSLAQPDSAQTNDVDERNGVHEPFVERDRKPKMQVSDEDNNNTFEPNGEDEEMEENSSWTSHTPLSPTTSVRCSANRMCIPQLDNVNRFAVFDISSSQQNWGQKFLGFNWLDRMPHCKFVVLDDREQILFVGLTRDRSNVRKGFFDMAIMDRSGGQIMNLRRIYAVKTNTMFEMKLKKRCRLEVTSPNGFVIGNVEKTYNKGNYYILEDRSGDCAFLIKRRYVTIDCPLLWDYEFQVMLPNNMTQIGEISWSSLTAQHEHFSGTEISFPRDLTSSHKSLLLGACFLLNCSRSHGAYLYNWLIGGGRKGGGARKST